MVDILIGVDICIVIVIGVNIAIAIRIGVNVGVGADGKVEGSRLSTFNICVLT